MDYVPGGEAAASGYYRLSGWQAFRKSRTADFSTLFQYLQPARMVDRAINPTSAEQRTVCGIDEHVYILFCDVSH